MCEISSIVNGRMLCSRTGVSYRQNQLILLEKDREIKRRWVIIIKFNFAQVLGKKWLSKKISYISEKKAIKGGVVIGTAIGEK